MKNPTRFGGRLLILLSASFVVQSADKIPSTEPVELSPVVITATRTSQSLGQSLASVSVITREQLDRQQVTTVAEALDGFAGIQFSNNGGAGKVTSLFMRGAESDQVLVLIDGVKMGSATAGTSPFQHIPVDQIERIEVVRGPRASLYGSDAIGGVIQIFTRSGKTGGQQSASVSVGAHDYLGSNINFSERFEKTWISLNADYQRTAGINSCQGSFAGGCFTVEPDRDGYKRKSGSLRIGHQLTSNLEIEFHSLLTFGKTEFDGGFTNEADFAQQVTGGSVVWDATDDWQITARAGISKDETDNDLNGVFSSLFDTQRISRSLQSDYQLDDGQLITLGYDFQDDQITSNNLYTQTSRRNEGLFGQYLLEIGQWSLQASGRRDSNEQFGSHETGGIAVGYFADNGITTTLSHGTAYKAPTFNELFFPFFGNANLDPEESKTTELGFSGTVQGVDWSSNFFHTSVDELISFDLSIFAPANISRATINGLELQASTWVAGWAIDAQFSFLDAKNKDSGANHNNLLPRRARRSFRLDADRNEGKWQYGGTLTARSSAFDDLANSNEIGGFVTLDLRGGYQLNRQWQIQLKANNLFDKKYRTAANFNQDGANLMMTLRWQDSQ